MCVCVCVCFDEIMIINNSYLSHLFLSVMYLFSFLSNEIEFTLFSVNSLSWDDILACKFIYVVLKLI